MNRLFSKEIVNVVNRITFTLCIIFCFSSCVIADNIQIKATPGNIYNLPESMTDAVITIVGSGSPDKPFVVSGPVGKTTMNGNSAILVTGNYIIVKNVSFLNNIIHYRQNEALIQLGTKKRDVIGDKVQNCSFKYAEIFDDKGMATQFFWIEVYGKDNVIDGSTFEGKQNRLPVIHVNSHGWVGEDNEISNCTFRDTKARKGGNGEGAVEAIRVGLGNSRSDCKIINNNFVNYFGDTETISCKSNGIVIMGNTFINCRSGVSLRASDSSIIKNNKFMTKNGVRVSGVGHQIINNIFDSPDSSSIIFMKGGGGCNYKQVNGIEISDNVFINKFQILVLLTKNCPSMPSGITLRHNFLYKDKLFSIADDNSDDIFTTIKPNMQNLKYGIGQMRFDMNKVNVSKENNVLKKVMDYRASKQNN